MDPYKLESGPWKLEPKPWTLESGPWKLESGPWFLTSGPLAVGIWTLGGWSLDPCRLESGPLELGICTLELGSWTLEVGVWTLGGSFESQTRAYPDPDRQVVTSEASNVLRFKPAGPRFQPQVVSRLGDNS